MAVAGVARTTGAAASVADNGVTTVPEHIMPIEHDIGSGESSSASGACDTPAMCISACIAA